MLGGSLLSGSSGATGGLSRDFFDLVKNIGESRSKQDEDLIMLQEIATLKVRVLDPTVTKPKMKEYLARALYVEMLGHDASFAHIHAVKLASDKNILCKRTGYMLCGLCLKPQDELMLLLVNTVQKDLASSDFLEVAAALNSCAQVIHPEAIPVLLPSVVNLLAHPKEMIRRKALSALLSLYKAEPSSLTDFTSHLKLAIHDSDPGVTSAVLDLIHEIASRRKVDLDAEAFVRNFDGLVPTLVSILRDIVNHKLPRDWDFHRVPAPWLQMKIMNLMTIIVEKDQALSEEVYEVLRTVITRCELQANVSYAVMYECIKTITCIYPLPALLEVTANCVSRFIEADTRNLQHAGLTGLSHLVEIEPNYVAKHQLAIIDCLDDRDETVRSRALELLAKTTTVSNVTAVVDKLLASADIYAETESKHQLIERAVELTNRWSPDHEWYISTLTRLFLNFSSYVPLTISHDLIRLVREGPSNERSTNDEFRRVAVMKMMEISNHVATVTDNALLPAFYIIGAYGYRFRPEKYSAEDILDTLIDAVSLDRPFSLRDLRSCLVTALLKHAAQMIEELIWKSDHPTEKKLAMVEGTDADSPSWLREIRKTLHTLSLGDGTARDWDYDISQKIVEFKMAIKNERSLKALYPPEGSNADHTSVVKSDTVRTCIEALMLSKQVAPIAPRPKPTSMAHTSAFDDQQQSRKRPASLQYRPYVDEPLPVASGAAAPSTPPRLISSGKRESNHSPRESAAVLSANPPKSTDSCEFKLASTRGLGGGGRWKLDGYAGGGAQTTSPSGRGAAVVTATLAVMNPQSSKSTATVTRASIANRAEETSNAVAEGIRLEEKKRVATELFAGVTGSHQPFSRRPSPAIQSKRPSPPPSSQATYDLLELDEESSEKKPTETIESTKDLVDGLRVNDEERKGTGDGRLDAPSEMLFNEGKDEMELDTLMVSTAGSLPVQAPRLQDETTERVTSGGPSVQRYQLLKISVEEVASTWQSLPHEVKGTLPRTGVLTAKTVLDFFNQDPYCFETVEAIGHEGLAATETEDGSKRIYLHCWVDAAQQSTQLTLRSDLSLNCLEGYLPTLLQDLSELV